MKITTILGLCKYLVQHQRRWERMSEKYCSYYIHISDEVLDRALTAYVEDVIETIRFQNGKEQPFEISRTEVIHDMAERIKHASNEHRRLTKEGRTGPNGPIKVSLDHSCKPIEYLSFWSYESNPDANNDEVRSYMREIIEKSRKRKAHNRAWIIIDGYLAGESINDIMAKSNHRTRGAFHKYVRTKVQEVKEELKRELENRY